MLQICLTLPHPKGFPLENPFLCFDIPVLLIDLPVRGPGPVEVDPERTVNWVTVDGKNPEWAGELRSLATIVALARRSPALQQGLQTGLREIARAIQARLPEGVEIHFDEPAYPAIPVDDSAS